jgi:flagellar hook-associated protein 3 FlgL
MIQGISPADERFLSALNKTESRAALAEREISSGTRLSTPSDAPDLVGPALSLRSQLSQTLQIQTNLGMFKSETDAAEQAVSNAVQTLQLANTLGAQGATETRTPAERQALAGQVDASIRQVLASANTETAGRYLFSGDTDQVAPYSIDASGNVSSYNGSASTRQANQPNGTTFAIARSGQEVFEAPGGSALGALTDLRAALQNGPSVSQSDPQYDAQYQAQTTAITNALAEVTKAGDQLNQQLAFYGVVQNNVADATNAAQTLEVSQRTQLSSLTDADITTDAIALTQANTQRDASLSARAKLPTNTLFDYLG